nr:hypothetical protein [Natronorubrum tibetense]
MALSSFFFLPRKESFLSDTPAAEFVKRAIEWIECCLQLLEFCPDLNIVVRSHCNGSSIDGERSTWVFAVDSLNTAFGLLRQLSICRICIDRLEPRADEVFSPGIASLLEIHFSDFSIIPPVRFALPENLIDSGCGHLMENLNNGRKRWSL